MGSRTLLSVVAFALVVASACGDEDTTATPSANGGRAATGGTNPAGGAAPLGGNTDGGLLSQAGKGAALPAGGSAAAAGSSEGGRAGSAGAPESGGVAGAGGAAAGTSGAGLVSGAGGEWESGGAGGRPGTGGRPAGGDDLNLGGMDGIGGTFCWWPGVSYQQLGELTYAYDLPEDAAACAQEACDSPECGHNGGGAECGSCTVSSRHDDCRCACLELYRECGDCALFDSCLGYCRDDLCPPRF